MSLGIGAMLGMLGGNEDSVKAFKSCVGKVIKELTLEEDSGLYFVMDDDTKMMLFDNGQSCCEKRYMRTDDKLEDFIGSKLLGAVLKSADNISSEWGDHEIEFLDVQTDRGVFQMVNHNEHNGYYGGFSIRAELK